MFASESIAKSSQRGEYDWIISRSLDKVIFRNYEDVITTYTEPHNYEENRNCSTCKGEKE